MLSVLFAGCAHIKAPSGGPDDTTPPEVSSCYPPEMTQNFRDFPIVLEFSEYVDKSSVVDNIHINPELKLKYSWKGKKLRISPAEPPLQNTTYCVSADPAFKDLSGNVPRREFSLIFSTGEQTDSCMIAGQVLEKAEGYSVFCYSLSGINPDTLDISRTKPHSKVKIGTSGKFSIKALATGDYRIFLVNDKNSDGLYAEGSEEIATAPKDLHFSQNGETDWITFLTATARDFVPPAIDKAMMTDCRTVKVMFTEPIRQDAKNNDLLAVIDSAGREIPVLTSYRSGKDSNTAFIVLTEKADKSKYYKVKIKGNGISDTAGNILPAESLSDEFTGSDDEKPTEEIGINMSFDEQLTGTGFERKMEIAFTVPLKAMPETDSATLTNAKTSRSKQIIFSDSVSDDINQIPVKFSFVNHNKIILEPKIVLDDFTDYTVSLKLKNINSFLGESVADTIIKITFATADTRFYGSISGSVRDSLNPEKTNKIIVTAKSGTNGKVYSVKTDLLTGDWKFPLLPADNYTLRLFRDSNGNGIFDCGSTRPDFEYSEKYYLTEHKVNLPKRWKIDDVILNISGGGE